eukprot:1142152-Pelagomonas_calceolata.AAC.6
MPGDRGQSQVRGTVVDVRQQRTDPGERKRAEEARQQRTEPGERNRAEEARQQRTEPGERNGAADGRQLFQPGNPACWLTASLQNVLCNILRHELRTALPGCRAIQRGASFNICEHN